MPLRSLVGALPGLAVAVLGVLGLVGGPSPLGVVLAALVVIFGLALMVAGLAAALATGVLSDLWRLPRVGFGITSGRGASDADLALTPWLHDRLQELAGLARDGTPLTFGMLAEQQIELQVMTTNLSRLEPMSMPWTSYTYFYDEAEFEALFGPRVIRALVAYAPPAPTDPTDRRRWDTLVAFAAARGLRPMPPAAQLPVIVAVRMSLSFPLLISAVPLHAPDETTASYAAYRDFVEQWWQAHPDGTAADLVRDAATGAGSAPDFAVNWFSDGGLTSNLPVHFFDGPLPTRPTFAIDLAEFSRDHPRSADEADNTFLRTDLGLPQRRTRDFASSAATGTPLPRSPFGQLLSFAVALVETARTWVDEQTLAMPGYRDRVVTVYQGGGEGGLNLSMPPAVVTRLSERGRWAARKLVAQFGPTGGGWPNHRWIRFRATTSALTEWLGAFDTKYAAPVQPSYEELLVQPPSYPIEGDPVEVQVHLDDLRAAIERWEDVRTELVRGRPQVPPVLRLTAPTGPDRTGPAQADPALDGRQELPVS